ncbi:PTS lactose/cellobiose transporter subunit IIA [Sodalis sp. C49]|uniref:PTS lactose/cellobiose transporter subunit IIA n=1 Tax=unclassified Sodalis (in: enterobacteria) TaxID=2636512 RepID=UPI003965CA83
MIDMETTIMTLLVNAGEARSLCMTALACARDGDVDRAGMLLADADNFIKAAHRLQTGLIGADQGEGKIPMTLILVHAQDHLMNAILARELINEMVILYQRQQAQQDYGDHK